MPIGLAAQPEFGGFLRLDKRVNVGGDSLTIADFYNRFRLETTTSLGQQLYVFSSADFRFYDLPRVSSLEGLEDATQEFPTELTLWEAYVDVYGFLSDNFDLRVGKQRLAWGTADKLNPTDNLNPDDFSDLVNFTDKIPTWAVKGTYYFGDVTLTGVWLPTLTPILLPRNGASLFLGEQVSSFQNSLTLPAQRPQNSMFGVKLDSRFGLWDYSLSYFNGYDDIPVLRRLVISDDVGSSGQLDLGFPKMQVIGADFATELFGAGFWGEGALFIPEKVVSQTTVGNVTQTNVELDDEPYFKFTLGGDYTFPNGFYVNGQWMHGFFTERGREALHDYFFLELEKSFLRDEVKVKLDGALEIADWNDIGASYGSGVFPEVTYQAIDNLEMSLGAFMIINGEADTFFENWQQADQVYMSVKVDF
ncbi:hypothetical protein GWN42_01130 [candidate division KSB1 bacterium]|nr:hypothetical protein [candidate division KSB1 bacterium]